MIQKTDPFATRPAGHFATLDCDTEEYHRASDGISNSMLTTFLDDPQLFYQRYISRELPPPKPTPEMEFGSLVHACLLEGADPLEWLLGDAVIIPPEVLDSRGYRVGQAWKRFQKENAGRMLVKEDEVAAMREQAAAVEAIRKNVMRDRMASKLLHETQGRNEYSIEWTHDATGLLLRARLDRLTDSPLLIADLKTTPKVDTESIAATCCRFAYSRQGAFYRLGVEAMEGEKPPFVVIALRKTPPYTVTCVRLSDDFLELGQRDLDTALAAVARCRDSGKWEPPTAHYLTTIEPPRWARYATLPDWSE